MMTAAAVIGAVSVLVGLAVNLAAIAYGYGVLNNRMVHCEASDAQALATTGEIFARLREVETVAVRLSEAASRWERVLNNGITEELANLNLRLSLIEQHIQECTKRAAPR